MSPVVPTQSWKTYLFFYSPLPPFPVSADSIVCISVLAPVLFDSDQSTSLGCRQEVSIGERVKRVEELGTGKRKFEVREESALSQCRE